jgi:hypothetical protein
MDNKTNYLEDALLNAVLRNIAFSSPATVYVGLFTGDPGEGGSLAAEVSAGEYTRMAVAFGAPSGGTCANTGIITFPTAVGSWGIITYGAILDSALPGGNVLYSGTLAAPKTVDPGDTVSFAIGALTVSES